LIYLENKYFNFQCIQIFYEHSIVAMIDFDIVKSSKKGRRDIDLFSTKKTLFTKKTSFKAMERSLKKTPGKLSNILPHLKLQGTLWMLNMPNLPISLCN